MKKRTKIIIIAVITIVVLIAGGCGAYFGYFKPHNEAVDTYNVVISNIKEKNKQLDTEIKKLQKLVDNTDKPLDKSTVDAAKEAIQSPLLETSIEGAKGVIINITGGEDLGLHEVNTAAELVQRSVDPEANIIFGTVTDPNMTDEIQITVIATGFEKNEPISSIGVDNIVSKTWEKKINSIPSSSEVNASQNDLDIPSFLRKNKNKNM